MSSTLSKKVLLIFGIFIMALLINIDYTAVNLALVTISNDLHTDLNVIQWILSGYVLAWAAIVIPAGKCTDIFSQRSVCLFGLCLFMISSVLAGLSTSAWMIIGSRVLQGMSGAIFVPTLYSLIFTNIAEKHRGVAMGFFSLGVGIGAAIGPSFGGLMLTTLGWSWIFYINVPLTSLAMVCILISTSKEPTKQNAKIELQFNALVLSLCIVLFLYTLNQLNTNTLFSFKIVALLGSLATLATLFILKEKKTENRTIPKSLMQNKKYSGISIAFAIEQFCFSSSYVALGLYMQKALLYSAYYSSIVFLALTCIFAVISTSSGIIVDKVGVNRPALLGFIFFALGSYTFLLLPEPVSTMQLIGVLLLIGVGMGLAFSSLNTGMMTTVKQNEIGIASSVFIMLALVGNALGVVISTLIILSYDISVVFNVIGILCLIGAGIIIKMMRLSAPLESTL